MSQLPAHERLMKAADHLTRLLPPVVRDDASISTVMKTTGDTVLFVYLPVDAQHFRSTLPERVDGFTVVYEFSEPYTLN
jgi:hypothetical protein